MGIPGRAYMRGDVWPLVHRRRLVSVLLRIARGAVEFAVRAAAGGSGVRCEHDEAPARRHLDRRPTTRGRVPSASDRALRPVSPNRTPRSRPSNRTQVRLGRHPNGDIRPRLRREVQDHLSEPGLSRMVLIGAGEEHAGPPRVMDGTDRNFSSSGGRITPLGGSARSTPRRRDREAAGVRRSVGRPRHELTRLDAVGGR